jgi:hypothetical protein
MRRLPGAGPIRPRPNPACGDCYGYAIREAIRWHRTDTPVTVLHGTIYDGHSNRRIQHAWVERELGDSVVAYDWQMTERGQKPIFAESYREIVEAEIDAAYPGLVALRMATATGNLGPWTEVERRRVIR